VSESEGAMRFDLRFPVPERRRRLRLDESGPIQTSGRS